MRWAAVPGSVPWLMMRSTPSLPFLVRGARPPPQPSRPSRLHRPTSQVGALRSPPLPCDAGEATVHDSRLLHAVSRLTGGVRYSLIIFYGCAADLAEAESADADGALALERALEGLPDAVRSRLLAERERAQAPVERALEQAEAVMEQAYSHAAPAKAAIERARAEEAEAAAALRIARANLEAALSSAKQLREQHFEAQVRVQRLRVERAAVRREAHARLLRMAIGSRDANVLQ